MPTLGNHVKRFRLERGLTQEDVEKISRRNGKRGITQETISFIESGKTQNPSKRTLVILARTFGVSIPTLIYGT